MTTTKLLMAVFGILSISMIGFAPITVVAQTTSTSDMSINIVCGLSVGTSLNFGSQDVGSTSDEFELELTGTGSGSSFDVDVSAQNWLNATGFNIIDGDLTKFSGVTGDYASKSPLNGTNGVVTMGIIPVGSTNSTFWMVLPTLNVATFAGSISQEMTFVVSGCV